MNQRTCWEASLAMPSEKAAHSPSSRSKAASCSRPPLTTPATRCQDDIEDYNVL